MSLARRSVVSNALAVSIAALLIEKVRAQTVEVYPGPGVDTYKSNLYQVDVFNGSAGSSLSGFTFVWCAGTPAFICFDQF